ncbi:MAG TPA: DUF559 domain-containing protein [Solirubrobacteraceae bacterium]|nr:DUF559 domain-containing protein [Solirubrobacteraceae bacterium]
MRLQRDTDLLARIAARQSGRITTAQLHHCGLDSRTIGRWVAGRRLHETDLRGVYALGYLSGTREARLWGAVLLAGPGAMLSHLTAAQHRGLITYAPATIHVSTPRKIAPAPGLHVHGRRPQLIRSVHAGIPVTSVAQTLLDLAVVRADLLPRALGQLDFQRAYDPDLLEAAARSGAPGAPALAHALATYDPNLARLNGPLEFAFYDLCVGWQIVPLPIPNVEVAPGLRLDALWPEHGVGVELDGSDNHHSDAQALRDAERDLRARRLGLIIIRYRRAQIRRDPDAVREDLCAQLAARRP